MMPRKLRALDLFAGGGGAVIGIHQAGFDEIVGIDIKPHRNYPFDFIKADIHNLPVDVMDFDFLWASPPCQRFSVASKYGDNDWERHHDFIPFVRELLKPHPFTVIENVVGSPIRKDVILTGVSMGLPYLERRRHFETSFFCLYPKPQKVKRKYWERGLAITVTKSMSSSSHWYHRKRLGLPGRPSKCEVKAVMGIPQHQQMTYAELGEAIPPAYSEFIAREAKRQIELL